MPVKNYPLPCNFKNDFFSQNIGKYTYNCELSHVLISDNWIRAHATRLNKAFIKSNLYNKLFLQVAT